MTSTTKALCERETWTNNIKNHREASIDIEQGSHTNDKQVHQKSTGQIILSDRSEEAVEEEAALTWWARPPARTAR